MAVLAVLEGPAKAWGEANGKGALSLAELCDDPELRVHVLQSL